MIVLEGCGIVYALFHNLVPHAVRTFDLCRKQATPKRSGIVRLFIQVICPGKGYKPKPVIRMEEDTCSRHIIGYYWCFFLVNYSRATCDTM